MHWNLSRARLVKIGGYAIILLAWTALLGAGFGLLMRYEATAARPSVTPAPRNESYITGDKFTLVLALHPQCPCSRATISELLKIYSRAARQMKITAHVFKPAEEPDSWIRSASLETLEQMSPQIIIDTNGATSAKLGLATSGQIQIFSPAGHLLYNGGLTAGRGHGGDNIGAQRALALIRGEITAAESSPTFGCSIQ